MLIPKSVQIHRFRQHAAISFIGIDQDTVYLCANDANDLANLLQSVVDDIRARPFTESTVGTTVFQCEQEQ